MNIEDVPIEKIHVGSRYRDDYGDVEALAQNIDQIGLLQPLGVDKYYNLIFGARRLHAAKRILQWPTIACHVINLDAAVLGEYSENEFRKQFTASERVAIAKAVQELEPQPMGRPSKESKHNNADLPKGQTRDIAAKKAGFGSHESYTKAATVVEIGSPELVAAMDKGDVSIAAAEVIAKNVPKAKQPTVVSMPKNKRKAIVQDARKKQQQERMRNEGIALRTFERWVIDVADFSMRPKEFWEAVGRTFMPDFMKKLDKAINTLVHIKEAHPSGEKRPRAVR